MKSFSTLPLSRAMLINLKKLNYEIMTPIQEKSIPFILEHHDVLARAKTGSGKTAAYGIGILHNLNSKRYRIQALVLCPTRELAEQVSGELRRIARFEHNIKLLTLTGGMPMYKQEKSLSHEAHIVVGTPGRVLKLLQRQSLLLKEVGMVVLDEADRMLDMGFIDQISSIFKYTPKIRQTLCFSATFPDEILKLSKKILTNPKQITVETLHDVTVIDQHFYKVSKKDKSNALLSLLFRYKPEKAIIFCNTKETCKSVGASLKKSGIHCLCLHGDLEQKERTEGLIRFSNGSSRVLIATDIAARGLDIDNLSAVINYDLPFESETYVHRIGRCGRAGKEGLSLSLMASGEEFRIEDINTFTKNNFQAESIDMELPGKRSFLKPEMVTLSVNGGRKNKISAGDILGVLTSKNGISGSDVGKIDRLDYLTFVAVKPDLADRAFAILKSEPIKGRRFKAVINE